MKKQLFYLTFFLPLLCFAQNNVGLNPEQVIQNNYTRTEIIYTDTDTSYQNAILNFDNNNLQSLYLAGLNQLVTYSYSPKGKLTGEKHYTLDKQNADTILSSTLEITDKLGYHTIKRMIYDSAGTVQILHSITADTMKIEGFREVYISQQDTLICKAKCESGRKSISTCRNHQGEMREVMIFDIEDEMMQNYVCGSVPLRDKTQPVCDTVYSANGLIEKISCVSADKKNYTLFYKYY